MIYPSSNFCYLAQYSPSLFHQVFLSITTMANNIITVMNIGSFIHSTTYIGKIVRQSWPMMPRETLNMFTLKFLLPLKEGSSFTTISCTGFQKPQGRTTL